MPTDFKELEGIVGAYCRLDSKLTLERHLNPNTIFRAVLQAETSYSVSNFAPKKVNLLAILILEAMNNNYVPYHISDIYY